MKNEMNWNLDTRQTLTLLNAQLAFFVSAFADCSLMVRACLFAWLISALLKCKDVLSEVRTSD